MNKKFTLGAMLTVVLTIVILFTAAAELWPELDDAGDLLSDNQTCEDSSGYWNQTSETCTVDAGNITLVSYQSFPLGGIFAGAILGLLLATILIVGVLKRFGIMK